MNAQVKLNIYVWLFFRSMFVCVVSQLDNKIE